jgi:uncharacterized protein (DUF1684 family)
MKQSHRWIPGIVLSLGMVVMVAAGPKDASWQSELQSWRVERAKNLQAPEGWLSLIGLNWLNEGDNSFGAVEGNLFQISAKVPAHIAVLRLQKGTLRLLPPAEGFPKELKLDGKPASEATLFADDAQNPSKLTIGTVAIIIIHRDERYALRVKDTQAPSRSTFHGLSWYAPDEHYRIHAKWIPYTPPKILDIPTILGTVSKLPAPGVAEFTIEGRTVRLEPVLESPDSKRAVFHSAGYDEQDDNVWGREIPLYRAARSWRCPTWRCGSGFQSLDQSSLRIYGLCNLSATTDAEPATSRNFSRREEISRITRAECCHQLRGTSHEMGSGCSGNDWRGCCFFRTARTLSHG